MKLKDERLEVVRLMLGLGGYDAGQAYRATQALETIDAEIAALKAEVERITSENINYEISSRGLEADLARERERSEKLAGAIEGLLSVCSCNNDCAPDDMTCATNAAKQALLAAKRDEGDV